MHRVDDVEHALLVLNGQVVPSYQHKLGMWHGEFLAVGGSDHKRTCTG